MAISFKESDNYLIFVLDDRLDSLNAGETMEFIEEKLKESGNPDKDLVFDFENLEYISSAGLQILLSCAQDRKSIGKKVYIKKPKELVDNVIKVAGFYSFLERFEATDD